MARKAVFEGSIVTGVDLIFGGVELGPRGAALLGGTVAAGVVVVGAGVGGSTEEVVDAVVDAPE